MDTQQNASSEEQRIEKAFNAVKELSYQFHDEPRIAYYVNVFAEGIEEQVMRKIKRFQKIERSQHITKVVETCLGLPESNREALLETYPDDIAQEVRAEIPKTKTHQKIYCWDGELFSIDMTVRRIITSFGISYGQFYHENKWHQVESYKDGWRGPSVH